MNDCVGGIVKHRPYDLSPYAGIRLPLYFDDRGDSVLVKEQVIRRPPTWPFDLSRNADLACHE